jgi:hypothetical protein
MLIEKIKTKLLIPADYNPRKDLKPGDSEYEKLKRSLEEFGYVEPVIWNKTTGRVVGGHQRLKIMLTMGVFMYSMQIPKALILEKLLWMRDFIFQELAFGKSSLLFLAARHINGSMNRCSLVGRRKASIFGTQIANNQPSGSLINRKRMRTIRL